MKNNINEAEFNPDLTLNKNISKYTESLDKGNNYKGNINLDKTTAKKTTFLNYFDKNTSKNETIMKADNNKNKNAIKNFTFEEFEKSISNVNSSDLLKNKRISKTKKNLDNKKENRNKLGPKNKSLNEFILKENSSIAENKKSDMNFHSQEDFNRKNLIDQNKETLSLIENSLTLISKKRNRGNETIINTNEDFNNEENINSICNSSNIKNTKICLFGSNNEEQNDIEEETKDNTNINEISNFYLKQSKFSNNPIFGNDFENIHKSSFSNYKNIQNGDFLENENAIINKYRKNDYNKSSEINSLQEEEVKTKRIQIPSRKNQNNSQSPLKKKRKSSNKTIKLNYNYEHYNFEKSNFQDDFHESNKIEDSTLLCISCGWEYPKEMDFKDKNEHVNFCFDGEGEKHKKMYFSSQRLIKIAINSQVEVRADNQDIKGIDTDNYKKTSTKGKDKFSNFCSLCSKKIIPRNGKTIDDHILECYKQKEQEIFAKSNNK